MSAFSEEMLAWEKTLLAPDSSGIRSSKESRERRTAGGGGEKRVPDTLQTMRWGEG
jgi:hypothetical protein